MDSLFGISTQLLAQIIGTSAILILVVIIGLSLTNRIMFRIGSRNITRTPLQSLLIVIGLMLSTTIIGASLGVGDTVTHSIRKVALEGTGHVDQEIEPQGNAIFGNSYISDSDAENIRKMAFENNLVDGVIFRIQSVAPAVNTRTNRTESRMILRGYSENDQPGFGVLITTGGIAIKLADLKANEILINEVGAETLDAKEGDEIKIITVTGEKIFILRSILVNGGLASGGSTPVGLLGLNNLQNILSRNGEIDSIGVSNLGGIEDSLVHSEEVTKYLRTKLLNGNVASQIFMMLKTSEVINELDEKIDNIKTADESKNDLIEIVKELNKSSMSNEFVALIGDQSTRGLILSTIKDIEDGELTSRIAFESRKLGDFRIDDSKADAIRLANTIGNGVTTFLSIFGSFSIVVGLLLIFLVMVLLAAARKIEMGMLRAVGFKRSHLIKILTIEGSIYAAMAATIGTVMGMLISVTLVELLRRAIGVDDFQIYSKFTITSLIITWGAGFILTLLTVIISSYRISKLNIVSAIRGLDEEFVKGPGDTWKKRIGELGYALGGPFTYIFYNTKDKQHRNYFSIVRGALLRFIPPVWAAIIIFKLLSVVNPILKQGWPLLIIGTGLAYWGANDLNSGVYFSIGVSILLIGIGLSTRYILKSFKVDNPLSGRIGSTLEGTLLLIFWGLPFDAFESLTGELEFSPTLFVLGGVAMVGSSVWILMNNTPIIIYILINIFGKIPGLRAVLKTAIAYPIASQFRTGLTISMFALIIFTLMINAVLNNLNNVQVQSPERVTGGFDIVATIPEEYPIKGFKDVIEKSEILDIDDFDTIAGSVDIPTIVRQKNGKEKNFKSLTVAAVETAYLQNTQIQFSHYDRQYGTTPEEIWKNLNSDASLAVISNNTLANDDPFGPPDRGFEIEGFGASEEPDTWKTITLEIRPSSGGEGTLERNVIAVIDPIADSLDDWERGGYLITAGDIILPLTSKDVPFDTFQIKLSPESSKTANDIVPLLETEFLYNGLDAVSTADLIETSQAQSNAFTLLFQGFMGLGLVVGVAAIGVLSIRAVVERRQSIGMLRAIGYRSQMIQLQFLAEALFITLMGVLLGLGLGTLTSWNIFNAISREVSGLEYSIPWGTVLLMLGITSFFALLSAYLPAKQAGKIYPAEALRYE
jgi:putative ABC transport system permease protein